MKPAYQGKIFNANIFRFDNCILCSIASTSSGGSTPRSNILSGNIDFTKTIPPLNSAVSLKTREFLQNVFSWQIVPSNAPVEASMIFGAVHLARLTSENLVSLRGESRLMLF